MTDAYGNIIEVPGQSGPGTEVKPSDIIASYSPPPLIKGATIEGGNGVIVAGTLMQRNSSSKLREPYTSGPAEGFLLETVDTGTGGSSQTRMGNIVLAGTLKLSKLVGLDANGITNLNARSDYARDLFIF